MIEERIQRIAELHHLVITLPISIKIGQIIGQIVTKDCYFQTDHKKCKQIVLMQEMTNKVQLGSFNQEEYEQNAISNAIKIIASKGYESVCAENIQSIIGANDIVCKYGGG